ncbi:hypothetical protein CR513_38046, partial [Mucuna pruriens]
MEEVPCRENREHNFKEEPCNEQRRRNDYSSHHPYAEEHKRAPMDLLKYHIPPFNGYSGNSFLGKFAKEGGDTLILGRTSNKRCRQGSY